MRSGAEAFDAAFRSCPLVAILRGVAPTECVAVASAIVDAGFTILEVPLNSPAPLDSITRLVRHFGPSICIGAGTVLSIEEVAAVRAAGGRLVVSPNTDAAVISATVAADMASAPGYWTPTEAFVALRAGAHALKLFPAEIAGLAAVKAHRAVLPASARLLAVGGVLPESIADYRVAGADGFGIGSALYHPKLAVADIGMRARAFVDALGTPAPGDA